MNSPYSSHVHTKYQHNSSDFFLDFLHLPSHIYADNLQSLALAR